MTGREQAAYVSELRITEQHPDVTKTRSELTISTNEPTMPLRPLTFVSYYVGLDFFNYIITYIKIGNAFYSSGSGILYSIELVNFLY